MVSKPPLTMMPAWPSEPYLQDAREEAGEPSVALGSGAPARPSDSILQRWAASPESVLSVYSPVSWGPGLHPVAKQSQLRQPLET